MNCDGVRGLLSAYVDGELSAGELLRVEQHLRRCHWCADEVDALRQTIALVASLEEVEVPAAFHAQLHNRLVALGPPVKAVRAVPARRAGRHDLRHWAMPAAAAAAVLAIGMASYGRVGPPNPVNPAVVAGPTNPSPGQADTRTPTGQVVSNETPGSSDTATPINQVQDSSGNQGKVTDSDPNGGGINAPVNSNPTIPTDPNTGGTSTSPRIHTATRSFLDNIDQPTSLPTQRQLGAAVEVATAEPAGLAEALKAHFPAGAVNEQVDRVSGIVTLQITVGAGSFGTELAFVERLTGVTGSDTSNDLSVQIRAAFDQLTALDKKRAEIDQELKGVTDSSLIEVGERTQAGLKQEADQARQVYQQLVDQVANGTITVTLKPLNKAQ